ncbi:unnamed protein product [Peniophora sp. CBMAI 1063]|nr:unnamed protein product [Peniophora sp. CBMAI 1063]
MSDVHIQQQAPDEAAPNDIEAAISPFLAPILARVAQLEEMVAHAEVERQDLHSRTQALENSNTGIVAQCNVAEARHAEVTARVDLALARAQAAATAATAAARPGGAAIQAPRMEPPPLYDGADTATARTFVDRIDLIGKYHAFPDDAGKIVWAVGRLDAGAAAWGIRLVSAAGPESRDWTQFRAAFLTQFGTALPKNEAATRLSLLSQEGYTLPQFVAYVEELTQVFDQNELDSSMMIAAVTNALTAETLAHLVGFRPASFSDLLAKLRSLEPDLVRIRNAAAGAAAAAPVVGTRPANFAAVQSSYLQPARPLVAATASRAATPSPPVPRAATRPAQPVAPTPSLPSSSSLPPAKDNNAMDIDAAQRLATVQCHKCHGWGHYANRCQVNKRVAAAIVSSHGAIVGTEEEEGSSPPSTDGQAGF